MPIPICDICAKSGVLCNACDNKLKQGKISDLEVKLSQLIYELGKGEIGFEHAIETDDFIIILTGKENIGKIIGKSGTNIRALSEKLGKQVRVISVGNLHETIHDLAAPARILGINTVYLPDNSTIQRVRINRKDKAKLRMNVEDVSKLVSSLAEGTVEITFE